MSANTAHDGGRATRLRRLDLAEDEARAVEHMWNWPALWLIANERILYFAENGYDAIDTLDAIWHGLDGVVGHTYMRHGLTPHQGFLIHTSPAASLNMWGPDRDIDRVHRLLGTSLPPDMVAVILLESDSPEEAERLIAHYVDTGPDYTEAAEEAELRLAGMLDTDNYSRAVGCDCLRSAGRAKDN